MLHDDDPLPARAASRQGSPLDVPPRRMPEVETHVARKLRVPAALLDNNHAPMETRHDAHRQVQPKACVHRRRRVESSEGGLLVVPLRGGREAREHVDAHHPSRAKSLQAPTQMLAMAALTQPRLMDIHPLGVRCNPWSKEAPKAPSALTFFDVQRASILHDRISGRA
jgi:hypothetical protein